MSEPQTLNLATLARPMLKAVMPDGKAMEWDIFEVAIKVGKIADRVAGGASPTDGDMDIVRESFGLPTSQTEGVDPAALLHPFYCIALMNALMDRFDEVTEVKKIFARSQK